MLFRMILNCPNSELLTSPGVSFHLKLPSIIERVGTKRIAIASSSTKKGNRSSTYAMNRVIELPVGISVPTDTSVTTTISLGENTLL